MHVYNVHQHNHVDTCKSVCQKKKQSLIPITWIPHVFLITGLWIAAVAVGCCAGAEGEAGKVGGRTVATKKLTAARHSATGGEISNKVRGAIAGGKDNRVRELYYTNSCHNIIGRCKNNRLHG